MPVSFHIDYDLMRDVYRLDTEKMLAKGDIKDIQEVVVGLDEIIGEVDKDMFLDEFAQNLANRFGWELAVGDFSEKEKSGLK